MKLNFAKMKIKIAWTNFRERTSIFNFVQAELTFISAKFRWKRYSIYVLTKIAEGGDALHGESELLEWLVLVGEGDGVGGPHESEFLDVEAVAGQQDATLAVVEGEVQHRQGTRGL